MQVIGCWSILEWDGCDRHNHKFYISSEDEACRHLDANKHDIVERTTLVIFDTLEEVEENKLSKLRESALAKLTPLERKALGF